MSTANHVRGRHSHGRCRAGCLGRQELDSGGPIGAPIVKPLGLFDMRLFDLGGMVGVAGMVTTFVITCVRNTRALYLEETTRS